MRRRVLLCLTLIAMSACEGDKLVRTTATPGSSTHDISDAVHDGAGLKSNPDFFFLPPMVQNASGSALWDAGAFNPNLKPTVDVCASEATTEEQLATAICAPLASIAAAVDVADEQYHANWQVPSTATIFYRVTIRVGARPLGFADLKTGSNASQLKKVDTDELIPLVDGRTLPIKFRVERFALCEEPGNPAKPCTSSNVDFAAGGTVSDETDEPSGVIIFANSSTETDDRTVTVSDCSDLNPRATDLPTFGKCFRVTVDPALEGPLAVPATVFSCAVFEAAVASGVTGSAQAERIALHQLNEQGSTPSLVALPHAHPSCPNITTLGSAAPSLKQLGRALVHGQLRNAARQLGALLSPRPLYAARFIDLGGGGRTLLSSDQTTSAALLRTAAVSMPPVTIRDFQFALPAKFEVSATPADRAADPGSTVDLSVKVTDLAGEPVRNARVHFETSDGSSLDRSVVDQTSTDGFASVRWTLNKTPGVNTLRASGLGIAGADNNGPRDGIDPFQPRQTHWGDASTIDEAVTVSEGSISVTATTAGSVSGTVVNAADGTPVDGAKVTIGAVETTAKNGMFSLDGIAIGTYDVTATADGFESASRRGVVIAAGSNTALEPLLLAPVSSSEVVVFNDFNMFDDYPLNNDGNNRLLVQNLVTFTHPGPRESATSVLIYGGHKSRMPGCIGTAAQHEIANAGYAFSAALPSKDGSLPQLPSSIRVVFLCLPTTPYSATEINILKSFIAEGGRIIFVGEHAGFYGPDGLAAENQFLKDMGSEMGAAGESVDCGSYHALSSTSLRASAITSGLTGVTIGCSSILKPAAGDIAFLYDSGNTLVLAAVASVNTVPLKIEPAPVALAAEAAWSPTLDPIGNPITP